MSEGLQPESKQCRNRRNQSGCMRPVSPTLWFLGVSVCEIQGGLGSFGQLLDSILAVVGDTAWERWPWLTGYVLLCARGGHCAGLWLWAYRAFGNMVMIGYIS